MKLTCIAIDDEPLALKILESYCSKNPFLELYGIYTNPMEALKILQEKPIDLIFLDIRMPDISGFQFLQSLTHKPMVILTTAYSQYGPESYDFAVIDYLLKPIPLERFVKAVNRAVSLKEESKATIPDADISNETSLVVKDDYIFVNSEYKLIKINIDDVLIIEGLKDYIKIHLVSSDRPVLTIMRIKTFEENLPNGNFMRVHRSFIINTRHIDYIKKNRVYIGKHEIPVGDMYADTFSRLIEGKNWK